MPIIRYTASADNTITNAFKEDLKIRGTGSNMGQSDIIDIFSIYAQASSGSVELSRGLIKFPITKIKSDRTAGTIPASGSVRFKLKLYNAEHGQSVPNNYSLTFYPASASWEEGYGLDMDNYTDITNDGSGSNWLARIGTDVVATATWTFADKPNEATTIKLTDYEGTSVTFEVNNDGDSVSGSNVSMDPATNNAAGMAAIMISSVQASALKMTATTGDGATGEVLLTQDKAGAAGNKTITLSNYDNWNSNTSATFPTAFTNGSNYTPWTTVGGDYLTASVTQTFDGGLENIEVDISTFVENWIGNSNSTAGTFANHGILFRLSDGYEGYFSSSTGANDGSIIHNTSGAKKSYYIKKFFGRGSEFFFARPVIEAQYTSSIKDNRGNFYLSSKLASSTDNLNKIYLYNTIRNTLTNIPSVTGSTLTVKLYSSTTAGSSVLATAIATGVSTGIYSASVGISGSYSTLYDVWSTASGDGSNLVEFYTGSISPKTFETNKTNQNKNYMVSVKNAKKVYNMDQIERFRLYVREKNWSPTIYTVAQKTPENLIIEDAVYKVIRLVDDLEVIKYGTGSVKYSSLSYDLSGNYFDLSMDLFEKGYQYGVKFSFYDSFAGSYVEQPYTFKFRVD